MSIVLFCVFVFVVYFSYFVVMLLVRWSVGPLVPFELFSPVISYRLIFIDIVCVRVLLSFSWLDDQPTCLPTSFDKKKSIILLCASVSVIFYDGTTYAHKLCNVISVKSSKYNL